MLSNPFEKSKLSVYTEVKEAEMTLVDRLYIKLNKFNEYLDWGFLLCVASPVLIVWGIQGLTKRIWR